jgi:cytochrome c6
MYFSPWQKSLAIAFSLFLAFCLSAVPAFAAPPDGAVIFENTCAGCHVNGGNIMRRGKNLKLKTLQKNGVDSVEAIAQLVTNGKGSMGAYGDRLSVVEIDAVAKFVLESAEKGWKK